MKCKAVVIASCTFAAMNASAGAYKCSDASGKVSYQQQPCAAGSSQAAVNLGGTSGGGWMLVKSTPFPGGGGFATYLDSSSIKSVGRFKRVKLAETDGPPPSANTKPPRYAFYDCANASVTGEREKYVDASGKELDEAVVAQMDFLSFADSRGMGLDRADTKATEAVCGK